MEVNMARGLINEVTTLECKDNVIHDIKEIWYFQPKTQT